MLQQLPWAVTFYAIAGFISMGESWHNNHHAYPGSEKLGLAWSIRLPQDLPFRPALRHLNRDGGSCPMMRGLERLGAAAFRPRRA